VKRRPRRSLLLDSRQHLLTEDLQEPLLVAPDLVNEDHVKNRAMS
jgi:hypothetical protein